MRGWLLLCKAWRLRRFMIIALVTAVAWLVVPSGPVTVPARDGVRSLLWPLVPMLLAGALPTTLAAGYRDTELTAARSRTQLRGGVFLIALALSLAPSLVAVRFDILVIWRNTGFLIGLALLSTAALPQSAAWLPVCVVPMWMWLLGTTPDDKVESWAVLLQPSHSVTALITTLVLFSLGAGAYWTIRSPRRSQAARG